MVRTLQVRFVRTAMIAITVLLLVVVCAISGINTYRTYTDVKQLADMLLDNRGIPDMGMMEPGGPGRGGMAKDSELAADSGSDFVTDSDSEYATDPDSDYAMDPEDWDESDDADDGDDRGWFRGGRRISPDHAMSTRYFLVLFAEDGTVLKTDTSKIYSISSQKAQEMAQEVLAGGKESGLTERFLYKMKKTDDGATVVFMDVSSELSSVLSVIVISFVIAAIGWSLMLLLVIALSKKAITPIAENIVRQKQFVTNAGHELKTPLAIIMANTEALELYTGESKWTRNIKDQTKRLSGLMQNLLTLYKMDEPDLKLPKEDWDLGKLLAESAAPLRSRPFLRRSALRWMQSLSWCMQTGTVWDSCWAFSLTTRSSTRRRAGGSALRSGQRTDRWSWNRETALIPKMRSRIPEGCLTASTEATARETARKADMGSD